MPFGKYKGQPISILETDPGYCDWLIAQPSIRREHPVIYNFIINNCQFPTETPEHNFYQSRFLNKAMQMSALQLSGWAPLNPEKFISRINEKISDLTKIIEYHSSSKDSYTSKKKIEESNHYVAELENLKKKYEEFDPAQINPEIEFECDGWDVLIKATLPSSFGFTLEGNYYLKAFYKVSLGLEIKPAVGDDYPQILRQMKASEQRHKTDFATLVYKNFDVSNLSLAEVSAIFRTSGFAVLSFDQLEGAALRYEK